MEFVHSAHVARRRPSLFHMMERAFALYTQRRSLSRLDESALRDLGVSLAEAQTEARRPIWDAPANWYI